VKSHRHGGPWILNYYYTGELLLLFIVSDDVLPSDDSQWNHSVHYCVTDIPNKYVHNMSLMTCSLACTADFQCTQFNYNQSSQTCSVFYSSPQYYVYATTALVIKSAYRVWKLFWLYLYNVLGYRKYFIYPYCIKNVIIIINLGLRSISSLPFRLCWFLLYQSVIPSTRYNIYIY